MSFATRRLSAALVPIAVVAGLITTAAPAQAGVATHLVISAPTDAVAGQPVEVTVSEASDDGVVDSDSSDSVHLHISDPQADPVDTDLTLSSGSATTSVVLKTAGTVTLTASSNAFSSVFTTTTVSAGDYDHNTLVGPSGATPGEAFTVTVAAFDAYGNPTTSAGRPIDLVSSDDDATFDPRSFILNDSQTVVATLTTTGTQRISAVDLGNGPVSTISVAVPGNHLVLAAPEAVTAGVPFTLAVTAEDTDGNVRTDQEGTYAINVPAGESTPAPVTLTDGVGSTQVTFTAAGPAGLSAVDGDRTFSTMTTVAAAGFDHFSVSAPATATRHAPVSVTVTPEDAYGNLSTGPTGDVHVSSSDPAAVVPADGPLTFDPDAGVASIPVTFGTEGSQTVTVATTDAPTSTGTSSSVAVGPAVTSQLVFSTPTTATAGTEFSFTVTAEDSSGDTVTTDESELALGNNLGATVSGVTLVDGVGTGTATSRPAGQLTLTAAETETFTSSSSPITVAPGPLAGYTINVGTSGGSSSCPVWWACYPSYGYDAGTTRPTTVTAVDAYGNVLTGDEGTAHLAIADPDVQSQPDLTFTHGIATTGLVFTKATSAMVHPSVTVTDVTDPTITSSQAVQVNPGDVDHMVLEAPAVVSAGAAFLFQPTYYDAYGNVTGRTTSSSYVISSSDPDLTVDDKDCECYSQQVQLRTAGLQTLSVRTTALNHVTKVQQPIVGSTTVRVDGALPSSLTVSAPTSAGVGAPATVTVTAHDRYGNVATPDTDLVHLTSSDGQAVLPADGHLVAGVLTVPVTFHTVGTQTVTGTASTLTATSGNVAVAVGALDHFVLTGAGTQSASSLPSFAILAKDAADNTVTGYSGPVTLTSTCVGATITPAVVTLSSGAGTATFGCTVAGTQILTATAGAASGTVPVSVTPAAADHLVIAAPSTVQRGAQTPITVTLVDAYGNLVVTDAHALHLTSSDPAADLGQSDHDKPLHYGVTSWTVALSTPGSQTITATETTAPGFTVTSSAITVPAPDTSADATSLSVSGPDDATAGSPTTVTVVARTAAGAVATTYSGLVHLTSSDPAAVLPADAHLTNGTATLPVTLRTTGNRSVSAGDGALSARSAVIAVAPGATTQLAVSAPTSAVAGAPLVLVVRARDAFGNAATADQGAISLTSTDAAATLPSGADLLDGSVAIPVALNTAGSRTITARRGGISSTTAPITVTAAPVDPPVVTTPVVTPIAVATAPVLRSAQLTGGKDARIDVAYLVSTPDAVLVRAIASDASGTHATATGALTSGVLTLTGLHNDHTYVVTLVVSTVAGTTTSTVGSTSPYRTAKLTLTGVPHTQLAGAALVLHGTLLSGRDGLVGKKVVVTSKSGASKHTTTILTTAGGAWTLTVTPTTTTSFTAAFSRGRTVSRAPSRTVLIS